MGGEDPRGAGRRLDGEDPRGAGCRGVKAAIRGLPRETNVAELYAAGDPPQTAPGGTVEPTIRGGDNKTGVMKCRVLITR